MIPIVPLANPVTIVAGMGNDGFFNLSRLDQGPSVTITGQVSHLTAARPGDFPTAICTFADATGATYHASITGYPGAVGDAVRIRYLERDPTCNVVHQVMNRRIMVSYLKVVVGCVLFVVVLAVVLLLLSH